MAKEQETNQSTNQSSSETTSTSIQDVPSIPIVSSTEKLGLEIENKETR